MAWFFERQRALTVRRLGSTELAHSVIFGFWLVAGFHLDKRFRAGLGHRKWRGNSHDESVRLPNHLALVSPAEM
jgi:hypothetical protein